MEQAIKEEMNEKIVQLEVSNLATSLAKAQGIMSGAKKSAKNPFFKSAYADLSSVFDAIREPFSKNGLSVTQTMDVLPDGKQVLCTRLLHSSGEFVDSRMLLPTEQNPQKLGSLITYYRRYSLMAIAGIPAEDDDGNVASGKSRPQPDYITSAQVGGLERLINGHDEVRKKFMLACNGNMGSLTVDRYPGAVGWIKELIEKEGG